MSRIICSSSVSFLCVFPEVEVTKTFINRIPWLVSVVGAEVIGSIRDGISHVLPNHFCVYFPRQRSPKQLLIKFLG